MIYLRSLLYFAAMVATILLFGLALSTLGWFLPMSWRNALGNGWGLTNLWLQRHICGLGYRIHGAENLPRGPAIVMAKHQSTWETIALRGLLRKEQAWVLKRELLWVPVFGWALAAVRPIAIDRKAGRRAAKEIIEKGIRRLEAGYTVIIFPEGTRTAPGKHHKYGIGGGLLAERSGYPVIPIAHNAGVFWRRRGFTKYPGTVDMVVGPVIDPRGRRASEITRQVEEWIEGTLAGLPQSPEVGSESR